MRPEHGQTWIEVEQSGFERQYYYVNHRRYDTPDSILASTVLGLGNYLQMMQPDLIVVHGDRVEALAGAIVGTLNNYLVAHIEGGELSGTVDEMIRHSVSKLSHIHFVANSEAEKRLIQMGEEHSSIYVIGSPDLDLMISSNLPTLDEAKEYYEIHFKKYAILIFHPVTTNLHNLSGNAREIWGAVIESGLNYVVVYPNNDPGSDVIIEEYNRLRNLRRFRIFPSIAFESFLVLLKNCDFIIGNSSSGIREAPFYGVPSINIGSRQHRRCNGESIVNVKAQKEEILQAIARVDELRGIKSDHFGDGNSTQRFIDVLTSESIWQMKTQKYFVENGVS